jgi:hypothetical protein
VVLPLPQPVVTTVSNVVVVSLSFSFGPTDAQTTAALTYGPSDASGNLLQALTPNGNLTVIALTASDLAAFDTTAGTPRQKAEAALTNHGLP